MSELILISSDEEYKAATKLFREYAELIGIDLGFQKFEEELLNIKSMYSPPGGGIILYKSGDQFSGCIAVRKQQTGIAELKRMFVQPAFQRRGIGDQLLREALDLAVKYNYSLIRLDTLDHMTQAISIYRKYGFYEIEPYYYNPEQNAIFFEKAL